MNDSDSLDLKTFLLKKGYIRKKLHLTKTNHFEIRASINKVKGRFILDTGASSSCVDFEAANTFNLQVEDSPIKATGAGASNMYTQLSKRNKVKIGKWKHEKVALILFNLTHVNEGLVSQNANAVDGIIGADILKKSKAIIDYEKKYLYLKL
ncbi:MAG TPA: retropepsin-like aspartic protease [Flavobacteriaceae bacterium]|nr:retropepsin-like aspartic protease [Flavobacteriaceae bacterium]